MKFTLTEILDTYDEEGEESTVTDIIANALDDLLGNNLGLLSDNVTVTYYEHMGEESLVPHDSYNDDLDIKSLMFTIPFGQTYTIELPPMNFDLSNDEFPLQISTDVTELPSLSVQCSFKLAFGFDDKDGFFIYTHRE